MREKFWMIDKMLGYFLIFALSFSQLSSATCWSSFFYHADADALALSIGPIESKAVCVYGSNPELDEECPLPCQLLLYACMGDCYKRNPDYRPDFWFSDLGKLRRWSSVREMFFSLAGKDHVIVAPRSSNKTDTHKEPRKIFKHASCRLWLLGCEEEWNL